MILWRTLLVAMLLTISIYTIFVVAEHGLGLFDIFFADMFAMGWPGQFNLDFMCMLILSGLWVAWRHHFSAAGLGLGVLGFLGGAPFLSAYLLLQSFRAKGDMAEILLGKARSTAMIKRDL
jgi:hypothetical protein